MYLRKKLKQEEGLISVMLSPEKMRVTVLGEITKRPVTITVLGKRKQYKVTDFSRSNEFDLAKEEHEVELLVISEGREFRRKFIVQKALN